MIYLIEKGLMKRAIGVKMLDSILELFVSSLSFQPLNK